MDVYLDRLFFLFYFSNWNFCGVSHQTNSRVGKTIVLSPSNISYLLHQTIHKYMYTFIPGQLMGEQCAVLRIEHRPVFSFMLNNANRIVSSHKRAIFFPSVYYHIPHTDGVHKILRIAIDIRALVCIVYVNSVSISWPTTIVCTNSGFHNHTHSMGKVNGFGFLPFLLRSIFFFADVHKKVLDIMKKLNVLVLWIFPNVYGLYLHTL